MESQAQWSGHTRACTHSQPVRDNGGRGTRGEGWRSYRKGGELKQPVIGVSRGSGSGKRREFLGWGGAGGSGSFPGPARTAAPPHLGDKSWNKTAGVSRRTSDRAVTLTTKTTKKLGLAALNISQTARETERLGWKGCLCKVMLESQTAARRRPRLPRLGTRPTW